jgi:hypothetical protein
VSLQDFSKLQISNGKIEADFVGSLISTAQEGAPARENSLVVTTFLGPNIGIFLKLNEQIPHAALDFLKYHRSYFSTSQFCCAHNQFSQKPF